MLLKRISYLGEVIKPGDKRVIHGEGMPRYHCQSKKGVLIINFKVEMPDTIPRRHRGQLREMLPGKSEPRIPNDAEHYKLTPVSADDHYNRRRMHRFDDDEILLDG